MSARPCFRVSLLVVPLVALALAPAAAIPQPDPSVGDHARIVPPFARDLVIPPLPEPADGLNAIVDPEGALVELDRPATPGLLAFAIEGPASAANSTYTFALGANYSRSAPWPLIDQTTAFNASREGIIGRLAITSPAAGVHTVNVTHRRPGGAVHSWCTGSVNVPSGLSAFILLCLTDNEHDELAVADMKARYGAWNTKATWDGVERGQVNWTMSTPAVRVGVHDLIQNDMALFQNVTEPRFWWRVFHYPTWTLRNVGNSSAYAPAGAIGDRGALIQIENTAADFVGAWNVLDFLGSETSGNRTTAFARDIVPNERRAINMSWVPGDVEGDPPTLRWRGLIRLTPNYYITNTTWEIFPRKVEYESGAWVYFYPDSVKPDDPAFANDWSWPIANAIADQQAAMYDIFHDRFKLGLPANTDGITIYSVRDGVNACGLASWNVGQIYSNCVGADLATGVFIHAMEFHHNIYMNGLNLAHMALPGYSGVIEGCAETGQVAVSETLALGKDLWTLGGFWSELDRDPYGNGYGHVYLLCQMWMDSEGEPMNARIRAAMDDFGVFTAYDAYKVATGTDPRAGEILWRWYVNDRYPGHLPTHPENITMNLPEPVHDVGAANVVNAAIPHVPNGKGWIARFDNFSATLPYTLTVTTTSTGFGASEEIRIYGFDADANGGKGAARIRAVTPGVPFSVPMSWTDSPDDNVGFVVFSTGDPFLADHTFSYSFFGTPPCLIGLPCPV